MIRDLVGAIPCERATGDATTLCLTDMPFFTDALIAEALSKFPVGVKPNTILCNRQQLCQLQQSRRVINPTCAQAPLPTKSFGIPIVVSER